MSKGKRVRSTGNIVQRNARRLVEDLILLAEAEEVPEWRNRSKTPLTAKLTQDSLIITFTISALIELTENDQYDDGLTYDQIDGILKFLEDEISSGILERPGNQQGKTQQGTIKLWDHDLNSNLAIFDKKCDAKRRVKNKAKSDPWQQIRDKIPSEFDLLDRSFFERREGNDVKILNLPSAAKNWSLITKGYYIDREQQEEALNSAQNLSSSSQGISFFLIRGLPGAGKTALMKWLVYKLSNDGYIVLRKKRDEQYWLESLEQFSQQNQGQHFYFFADDLFRDDDLVGELLANELQFPMTIIGTTRFNEDRQEDFTQLGYRFENLDLQLTSNDKERILKKIKQQDPEVKSKLAKKTRQEINILMDSPSMLVLMLQLSEGKQFDSIIADVIKRLPQEEDYPFYQVFGVICSFYQYGIIVYPDILPLCLPECSRDGIEYVTKIGIDYELKGLVNIVEKRGFKGLATVHELIAETAIQNAKYYTQNRRNPKDNLPYSPNLLEKYLKLAIPQLKSNQKSHRRWSNNVLRILVNNNQAELVFQLLKEYSNQIASLQQNSSITGYSYWSNMYARLDLNEERTRCLQGIINTEPLNSNEYVYKLSLIIQNSTKEQIKDSITATIGWLEKYTNDFHVRVKYLDLVQQYGTYQQQENAIASTTDWLELHPDDTNVRAKYLELIQQCGTSQQQENAIASTTDWLELHPDDTNVRAKYLASVGRESELVEDIKSIIDRQWQWINQQNKVEQNLWATFLTVVSHNANNNSQLIRQASHLALEQYPKDFTIACTIFYLQNHLDLESCHQLADFITNSKLPKNKWHNAIHAANFFRDYGELDKAEKIYLRTINNSRYCIDNFGDDLESTYNFATLNYAHLLISKKPSQWKKAMNKYLEPLLKRNPKHSLAHLYIAQCHILKIKNYKKNNSNIYNPIIHHFKQAIKYLEQIENKYQYEYEFGYFYWKIANNIMQARQHLLLSLRAKVNLPSCVTLAELELEAGKKDKAKEYIEQGLAIELITRPEKEQRKKLMEQIIIIQKQLGKKRSITD